jgi:hypothetical protein
MKKGLRDVAIIYAAASTFSPAKQKQEACRPSCMKTFRNRKFGVL